MLTTILPAKRVPYADYVVSIDATGRISEQGTFKQLSLEGGYVSTFNLTQPEWQYHQQSVDIYYGSTNKEAISGAELSPPVVDDDARRSGDISVYLYYISAVGWMPTMIFVVSITIFVFCFSFPSISPSQISQGNLY